MPYNWTKTAKEIKEGVAKGLYNFTPGQIKAFYQKIEGKERLIINGKYDNLLFKR